MNVFEYAAANERAFEKYLDDVCIIVNGEKYKRQTTFFSDLSIAEVFGTSGIKDTYKRVMEEWIKNTTYITEFVMCLNLKCNQHYGRKEEYCELYGDLYYKAKEKCERTLKGKDLQYFFDVLD